MEQEIATLAALKKQNGGLQPSGEQAFGNFIGSVLKNSISWTAAPHAAIMLRSGQGLPEEAQKFAQTHFPLRRQVALADGSTYNPRSTANDQSRHNRNRLLPTISPHVPSDYAAARPCVDLASLMWPHTSPRACTAAKDQVLRPYLWTEVQAVALQAQRHLLKFCASNRLQSGPPDTPPVVTGGLGPDFGQKKV